MIAKFRAVLRAGKRRVLFAVGLVPIAICATLPTNRRALEMTPERVQSEIEAAAETSMKDPLVIQLADLARRHARTPLELAQTATIAARSVISYEWDENVWGFDRVASYQEMRSIADRRRWTAVHGDCDDIAVLVIAVAKLCGIPSKLKLRSSWRGGHAWVELDVQGTWFAFDSLPRAENELPDPPNALQAEIVRELFERRIGNRWLDPESHTKGIWGTRAWAIAVSPALLVFYVLVAAWFVMCSQINQRFVELVPDWACKYQIPPPWKWWQRNSAGVSN